MEWEVGVISVNVYVSNKQQVLLQGTGKYIQYPVIQHHGKEDLKKNVQGTSLAVQWLRVQASTSGIEGSLPGQGTRICMLGSLTKKEKGWVGVCVHIYIRYIYIYI